MINTDAAGAFICAKFMNGAIVSIRCHKIKYKKPRNGNGKRGANDRAVEKQSANIGNN